MSHAFNPIFSTLFILVSVFLLNTASVHGYQEKEKDQLFVGLAKRNITPHELLKNWVTGKPYAAVEDSLFVHALVLNVGTSKAVIISWDLVDSGESATEEVRKAVSKETGIPVERILVNATHNHSAPWSPVYSRGHRGEEMDTWWAIRYLPTQTTDPAFREWMGELRDQTVMAVRAALDQMEPASLWIARADASEYMSNRRPRVPQYGVEETLTPKGYNFKHKDWNPKVLLDGAVFGPLDRTMTLISFRNKEGGNIASIFHLSIHAVSIYPFTETMSSDWPGEARRQIRNALGGEAMFLQGTAGDVNPWKRGREAVLEMGHGLASLAVDMYRLSSRLSPGALSVKRETIGLPLDAVGKKRTGLQEVNAEVQVITLGSLALVALPGEPLTDLGTAIRARSPYSQTLVLGYSNGNGVHYVGAPGEKNRGGYEMEEGTIGTDRAGELLIELAEQLLNGSH